jgi:hypothetical protein
MEGSMIHRPITHRLLIAGMFIVLPSGCAGAGPAAPVASRAESISPDLSQATPPPAPSIASSVASPIASAPAAARVVAPSSQPAGEAALAPTTRRSVPAAFEIGNLSSHANNRSAEADPTLSLPVAKSATLINQFDAQLARIIHDQAPDDSFLTAPTEERELVDSVLSAIADFRETLRDESGLLADKSAPMLKLSQRIAEQIPLTLPTVALCRSVQQFGVYDPIEPARFAAGAQTPVIIYCEVEHFRSHQSESQWETKLSYEAVLYSDSDHPMAVLSKKPANIIDHCRNRRRDFFLADRMTLPATLPAGKYLLKVTVIDQLANHVAEKSIPITIAPK